MITTILGRVLSELQKESPDISYIKGMVEVLIASEEKVFTIPSGIPLTGKALDAVLKPLPISTSTDPEAAIMDAHTKANIEKIKGMANIEVQ